MVGSAAKPASREKNNSVRRMAGGDWSRPLNGALSVVAWWKLRLLAGDSSMSARMERRSSVAEMTGKSTTSMQLKASSDLIDDDERWARAERRHSQQAGSASNSQARLSKSSMNSRREAKGRCFQRGSFSEQGTQVNVASGSGCTTLKLANRPAGLPVILESATQLTTAEGDDGISSAHRPKHSRPLQPTQDSFTACLNDSRAHE